MFSILTYGLSVALVGMGTPAWNRAGREEQVYSRL